MTTKKETCPRCGGPAWVPVQEPMGALLQDVPGVSRPCNCQETGFMRLRGRAHTPAEKRAVIERLYAAWCKMPEQRLSQLLVNAIGITAPVPEIFYREDDDVAEDVERFVKERGR